MQPLHGAYSEMNSEERESARFEVNDGNLIRLMVHNTKIWMHRCFRQ